MKDFTYLAPEERRPFQEASSWQLRLSAEPSLEVSVEFQAWISKSENQAAFDAVSLAWRSAEDFAVEPALLEMREAALRRARVASARRWQPRKEIWRLLAATIVIALIGIAGDYYYNSLPDTYSTAIGERRTITLSDGSRIALDSDSRIEVRYSAHARMLALQKGRARFDVAHDVGRPFSVKAGGETVVAVGTTFDVEKVGDKVLVTLIHGKIVVKEAALPEVIRSTVSQPSVSMHAGQELVAAPDIPVAIKPADLKVANAWEIGRLVFNGDTLAEAVARVNRYTDRPIQVDPSIASIRIIGSFSAGDVSTFVSAVTSYFPIQASTTADNEILLQPKA
jgi:transmembrane sensor